MRIFGLGDMRAETGRMAGISIIHSLITRILFLIIEFIFQEPHKSSLVRQNKLILTGENLRIVLRQGHLHYSIVLLLAEQNSNGGILGRQFHLAVIVVHIHLTRKCQPLIESRVELSLQLAQTPSLVCSLIFIEFAFLVICDAHEKQIV